MKTVPFFDTTITIKPHSASNTELLAGPISLELFAGDEPLALFELDNGDLRAETRRSGRAFSPQTDRFIEGPEVAA